MGISHKHFTSTPQPACNIAFPRKTVKHLVRHKRGIHKPPPPPKFKWRAPPAQGSGRGGAGGGRGEWGVVNYAERRSQKLAREGGGRAAVEGV